MGGCWSLQSLLEGELCEAGISAVQTVRIKYLLLVMQVRRLLAIRKHITDQALGQRLDAELAALDATLLDAERRLASIAIP